MNSLYIYKLYTLNGKLLLDDKYTYISPQSRYALARQKVGTQTVWGIVNYTKEGLVPFEYDSLSYNNYFGTVSTKKGDYYGLLAGISKPCSGIR
jgi:hypothetical protein